MTQNDPFFELNEIRLTGIKLLIKPTVRNRKYHMDHMDIAGPQLLCLLMPSEAFP